MAFYVGGTAGMRNMGTYAAGTTYFPNDLVQYNGTSYIAITTTAGNLPTNTTYWGVLAAGGSGLSTTTKTAAYTAASGEMVLADATSAAFTVTLPTSPVTNAQVVVKKIDTSANAVTVAGTNIDGSTTYALSSAQAAAAFTWDGAVWRVSSTAAISVAGGGGSGGGMLHEWKNGNSRLFSSAPFTYTGLASTSIGGNGSMVFFPMRVPNACTVTGMYFWASGNTYTPTVIAGVWADNPIAASGGPAARLFFGSFTTTNATLQGYTVSPSYTFTAGQTAWIGYTVSAATNQFWAALAPVTNMLPGSLYEVNATFTGNNQPNARTTSFWNYNTALPTDMSATTTNAARVSQPLVFFTVA